MRLLLPDKINFKLIKCTLFFIRIPKWVKIEVNKYFFYTYKNLSIFLFPYYKKHFF